MIAVAIVGKSIIIERLKQKRSHEQMHNKEKSKELGVITFAIAKLEQS